MPRLTNLCLPHGMTDLSACIKWKNDLIQHDADRFSFHLHQIKGIALNEQTNSYTVYYYNEKLENMAAFKLKVSDGSVIPRMCPSCDVKLANGLLYWMAITYHEAYEDCKAICISPDFGHDTNEYDSTIYVVYKDSNNKIDYTYEYTDNLVNETFDFEGAELAEWKTRQT